ncbi:MAG: glycerate kinase [Gracilibacteraceae bacterium]|jgi:glycerate kinase|nr:glycerate kinase [Gracilibacteraceae bacterium]
MKVLVALDSFKGSLTSREAGQAVAAGLRRAAPSAVARVVPMADGGEGTVDALVEALGGTRRNARVAGPLGAQAEAGYGLLPDGTAVIEMAAASGLPLVPPRLRDPRRASTRGTGELMLAALDSGARRLLIGIGGSATNDGGAGMAQALGARLLDAAGAELPPGGGALGRLARVDISGLDPRLRETEIVVISDVTNPLCGPLGASAVYGPQKGASPEDVRELDACLAHYARVLRDQLGQDIAEAPGAGAAGGLGAGLLVFAAAQLRRGTDAVLDTLRFDEMLADCDVVVTGEGRIDAQSAFGKLPQGVAARAKAQGKPALAIVGAVAPGAEVLYDEGLTAIIPICDRPMTLEEAIADAARLVQGAAERAFRLLLREC